MSDDADDSIAAVATYVGDGDSVADLRPSGRGRVDEDRVEHGATRGVESIDAMPGLDGDGHVVVPVVERAAADWWGAGLDHAIEQAPPVELENCTPHEGVG